MIAASFAFAALFAAIHLSIGWLTFLDRTPRSRWLSAAGGVSVAYVFLHILPELAAHQSIFSEELELSPSKAEEAVYLSALGGLVLFYGLEKLVKSARRRDADSGQGTAPGSGDFWLHTGSFALYNAITGYLLTNRETAGAWSLLAFGVAMSLHFVTTDFGLRQDHSHKYDRTARWIIAGAVLGGWALGVSVHLPELWLGFLFAFLSGGIILNVLKEELPEERESRFWPFAASALAYAAILLAA